MSKYLINRNNPFGFIDPFFDEFFAKETTNDIMKTDILDEGDYYQMKIELPDVKKENIKISLNDGNLTINAIYNAESDGKDKQCKFIRRERHYGNYTRSFYIGDEFKDDDIQAKLENGVLTLNINKKKEEEVKESKYISIE